MAPTIKNKGATAPLIVHIAMKDPKLYEALQSLVKKVEELQVAVVYLLNK